MMKRFLLLAAAWLTLTAVYAQGLGNSDQTAMDAYVVPADTSEHVIRFETTKGTFCVKLYNDTPQHRDNFLRLVREKFYDGILFHRVISGFMIQAGDSASRHAAAGEKLGETHEPYTVPAEIKFPTHFHKIGALAAARESDDVNPEKASSAWQFYVVTGRTFNDDTIGQIEDYLDRTTNHTVRLTEEQKEVYRNVGGAPHLDGTYTVFGEVVEGLDVVDSIQWVERDENNRPIEDVRILHATVVQ